MTKNRSTGIVAVVLGAVVAVMTHQLPASTISGDIGPAVFPYISAALLIVCGSGLIITGNQKEASMLDTIGLKRLAAIFGVVLLYCIFMNYLGFFIPSLAVLFVLSTMFAEDIHCPWWHRLIFSVVLTLCIYLLFRNVLNLKLPTSQLF